MASITLAEGAAASTPSSGNAVVYAKTDGRFYSKDDAGTEHQISNGNVFRKNAIINGDFQIWQGGTSFAAIASGTYSAEMWRYVKVGAMVHTVSQSSDVPTIAEAGRKIPYSLLIDCTTVDAAIAASDIAMVTSYVEGYNFVNIAGVGLCFQFWHKHTKTGTYCVSFQNSNRDRSFVREYTQAVSDTWELATVLIDASPSAGTWDYTTGVGLQVNFVLAAGTDFHGTAGTWNSADDRATANQVNACDSTSNNFMLAGVQLEKGSVATEFDAREFQDELAACQRYYEKSFPYATAPATNVGLGTGESKAMARVGGAAASAAFIPIRFITAKRTTPTQINLYNPAAANNEARDTTIAGDCTATTSTDVSELSFIVTATGNAAGIAVQSVHNIHWSASARF